MIWGGVDMLKRYVVGDRVKLAGKAALYSIAELNIEEAK